MIFPKIKESIVHSEFFRKNNYIPEDFYPAYKKIKNDYIKSKNEIKNKLKNDLVNFINSFLTYNIDDVYLENYVLDLIHEFGFEDINEIIQNENGIIADKVNSLNTIKLLNNDINVINDLNFVHEHCTPEYFIENKNNLDKNQLKNKHMLKFFDKIKDYTSLIKSKINIGNIDINHKYLRYLENLDDLFIHVIENKNIKYAKKLLEKGVNIHMYNDFALRYSSSNGNIEVVKFLVKNGANIRADYDFAIKRSSLYGHVEVVKFLVENGANIHVNNDYVFKESIKKGHIELFKFLIENGANIHAVNDYALRLSSKNGHIELVKFLIQSDPHYFRNNKMATRIIQKHNLNEFYNNLINS